MFSDFCRKCGCSPCRCSPPVTRGCCQGPTGPTGPRGPIGPQGDIGPTGPTGPSAVTVRVGATVTGQPGTDASVTDTGGTDPVLTFTIPQGATGARRSGRRHRRNGSHGPAGHTGCPRSSRCAGRRRTYGSHRSYGAYGSDGSAGDTGHPRSSGCAGRRKDLRVPPVPQDPRERRDRRGHRASKVFKVRRVTKDLRVPPVLPGPRERRAPRVPWCRVLPSRTSPPRRTRRRLPTRSTSCSRRCETQTSSRPDVSRCGRGRGKRPFPRLFRLHFSCRIIKLL